MLETAERMVFAESDDGDDARHHVQKERAEVTHQRDHHRALWKLCRQVVAPKSKAVPEVVRKRFDRVISLSARPGEIE